MSDDDDPAVTTALDVLDGAICECGHLEGEHSFVDDSSACAAVDGPLCDCQQFRPVDFHVTRATVKDPTS